MGVSVVTVLGVVVKLSVMVVLITTDSVILAAARIPDIFDEDSLYTIQEKFNISQNVFHNSQPGKFLSGCYYLRLHLYATLSGKKHNCPSDILKVSQFYSCLGNV